MKFAAILWKQNVSVLITLHNNTLSFSCFFSSGFRFHPGGISFGNTHINRHHCFLHSFYPLRWTSFDVLQVQEESDEKITVKRL